MARLLVLVLVGAVVLGFFASGFQEMLSLDALKASREPLTQEVARRPIASMAVFFGLYVTMAGLSLPGAALLTLGGGALFGWWSGFLIVSFASSLGALLAFLAARFVLRDAVEAKFSNRLAQINRGLETDGSFYLLTLRLVPILPFFVINLVMGLTRIKAATFYIVSQIGMIPATLLYVNAGVQLASLERISDILSPLLLASFVALGALPWLARAAIAALKQRALYAPYLKPRSFDRNLVVIGAGAGGLVASYVAATLRAKVTLVEAHKMGGDCLNYGCVPSKALLRAAKSAAEAKKSSALGVDLALSGIRFADLMARIHAVIAKIEPHDSIERYTGLGVDVVIGHARICDPWHVEITPDSGEQYRLSTRAIVIAAGASPVIPDIEGIEASGYLTSETLWDSFAKRAELPSRILILGGGPVGCELAQAFARLGSNVTLIDRGSRLLGREDDDVSDAAHDALHESGVRVLLSHTPKRFHQTGAQSSLTAEFEGNTFDIDYDALIIAAGRKARLEGYGLDALGIRAGRTVEVNAALQTKLPNIYAAGDVAGPYQLTHAAGHQGWHAAVNALFAQFKRFNVDYSAMPATTFLDPEIARVGMNERDAKAAGLAYEVTRYDLDDLDRAIADDELRGFVKVLTVKGTDRILGATIVGAHAGELLAEFTLAMRHSLGLNKLLSTIHSYPTFAEANKYAAGQWKKAHAPEKVLKALGWFHQKQRGG